VFQSILTILAKIQQKRYVDTQKIVNPLINLIKYA